MKSIIMATAALLAVSSALAQEKLSREESLKYAFVLCNNLPEMLNTPIPTDPDVKRPVAVRDQDYGGMVLPECCLKPDTFAKAGKEVVAVGQLWIHKLVPVTDGQPVAEEKLRKVHIASGEHEVDVVLCALGIQKSSEGSLQLLVYGKNKQPLLQVPLKAVSASQENPIEIAAERKDEGGEVTLKFVGKYEAKFMVTDPDA